MSSANPSGKAQRDRLVELEEQMLYLAEVPDSIRFLESRLKEITEKTDIIDAVAGSVEGLPIQELLVRVDTLEGNVGRTVNYEYRDSSSGFVDHMEECVDELDSSQKTLLEMISGMSEDFRDTLNVVRNEIADVNARLNLTMRAIVNQLQLEEQFRATNTVIEEDKVTLAMMHLSQDAKLWCRFRYVDMQKGRCTIDTWDALKRELRSQFFQKNVKILARQKSRKLKHTGSIRDSSPGRNRNSRPSSPKAVGGDIRSGKDRIPYQSTTVNTWRMPNNRSPPKRPLSCFICEGPHLARECPNKVDFHAFQASLIADSDDKSNQAKGEVGQMDGGEKTRIGAIKYMSGRGQTSKTPLEEGFRKNEGREFHCPTYCRTSETNDDKVERIERLDRFCGCKDGRLRRSAGNGVPPSTSSHTNALSQMSSDYWIFSHSSASRYSSA
ncbi:uncharacterized protein E5676_scaffold142G004680 [Cucumis melo var. makuwa]|uniref:Retrotransposon gag domain-containing protein n=1 Tax=Cucumis melo var. makuwa TaxID=1194695 RepID=A0A5A7T9Z3_CUCMM|nr:uncharacterized protein E6C27_scaffold460G00040 [Cucumis melo var. makuwa]TYK23401.1 uncharacterized protein E5676_scaffold142G004680 [Cucumis melo var. makuwa]